MYDAASLVQSQLEPARRVAALVEAFYQQPKQQAGAALELAQAAATRACANLRCPNVAGQGRDPSGGGGQTEQEVLCLPGRALLLPRVQRGGLAGGAQAGVRRAGVSGGCRGSGRGGGWHAGPAVIVRFWDMHALYSCECVQLRCDMHVHPARAGMSDSGGWG